MAQQYTREEIYRLRCKLKAPQRARAMAKRYEKLRQYEDKKYQEWLAKTILDRIG